MRPLLANLFFFFVSSFLLAQCPDNVSLDNKVATIRLLPAKQQISVFLHLYQCTLLSDSSKAKICKQLALLYYEPEKQYFQSIAYTLKEIVHWRVYGQQFYFRIADAYYNLAFFHYISYQYTAALTYYAQCIRFSTDSVLKSLCYKEMAELYLFLGDYENVIHHARKGTLLLRNTQADNYVLASCYNAWGLGLFHQELYSESLVCYQQALESLLKSSANKVQLDYLKGNIAFNQGNAYGNLKQSAVAIVHYKQSMNYFGNTSELRRLVYPEGNTAYIEAFTYHLYSKASRKYDHIREILEKKYSQEKSAEIARLYMNAAHTYERNNELEKAIRCAEQAFQRFPGISKAPENLTPADLQMVSDKGTFYDMLRTYSGWILLQTFKKKRQNASLVKALAIFKLVDIMVDIMRRQQTGIENRSKLHWRERTRRLYEHAIEACYYAHQPEVAFYYFERSRAVLLLDKWNNYNALQLLSLKQQVQEKGLQQKINELQYKQTRLQPESPEWNTVQKNLIDYQSQQAAFISQLEKNNKTYYYYKYDTSHVSLKQIQAYLQQSISDSLPVNLVEYFIGDSAIYSILVTPTRIKLHQTSVSHLKASGSVADTVDHLLQKFYSACANKELLNQDYASFLKLSHQLYQLFWQPIDIPEGRVIVAQDNLNIPFEALSKSGQTPAYLIHKYAISYIYSAQLLLKNKQIKGHFQQSFVGMAPVRFGSMSHLNELTGSQQSLQKVSAYYPNPVILLNAAANKNTFLKNSARYQIVQLYTHAEVDTLSATSVIYFADTTLNTTELANNPSFYTNLLILSACKTNTGKLMKGEGIFSLSRSFMALRIPSVVSTLWSVEDVSTYQLTELFHSFLSQGLPKDVALQKAKLAFIKNSTKKEGMLPTHWASLVLLGDTCSIQRTQTNTWIWMICLSLTVLGLGGIVLHKYNS